MRHFDASKVIRVKINPSIRKFVNRNNEKNTQSIWESCQWAYLSFNIAKTNKKILLISSPEADMYSKYRPTFKNERTKNGGNLIEKV